MSIGATDATASASTTKPKSYKDCKALNRDHPHGVGRKHARDRTSDEPVTNFKRSNRLYARNDGKDGAPPAEYDLDRDNDGIACEQP